MATFPPSLRESQLQILGEPLTNLPAFLTSNIVKAFQKRLMPGFVSRLAGDPTPCSWIGTRFLTGSPESFERIEVFGTIPKASRLKRFEKKEEKKKLGKFVNRGIVLFFNESLVRKFEERRFFFSFLNGAEKLRISVIIHPRLNVCAIRGKYTRGNGETCLTVGGA